MAKIFVYADSPTAGTGFGRSAKHVLYPLHEAGHTLVQLAVNHDVGTEKRIPWKVYSPSRRDSDPYGLWDLPPILATEGPFDLLWTTFDPEIPWSYVLPGIPNEKLTVLDLFRRQRDIVPGFKMCGWFPVDGGPQSNYELMVLADARVFDLVATMSTHVHNLLKWTHTLRGQDIPLEAIQERIKVVPHGVDLDLYRIASDEERADAKERLGFPRDTFLITQVERNQQRKQVWRAMEVLEKLRRMLPGKSIHLYQHMHMDEENEHAHVGWKLDELAWRYGLEAYKDVRWREGEFTEKDMVDTVYAAADVVLSVSAGEGFQYPLWEALTCGRRIVAPSDSARKAWLSNTPGAYLYKADEHGEVVRGGYNRRMARGDLADACRIIRKMVQGASKFKETGESSRNWVSRTASVDFVQQWWVTQVEKQLHELEKERKETGVAVKEKHDHVISTRNHPGLGDFVMMLPAIKAFRKQHPGESVCLAVTREDKFADLVRLLKPCDTFQIEDRVPLEELGERVWDISTLWRPKHRGGWSDPAIHRTDAVARFLEVDPADLEKVELLNPEEQRKATVAHFQQRFGIHPTSCVAICPQSGLEKRSMPEAYALLLADRIMALGLTPVLLGDRVIQCQRVGVLNCTSATDTGGLIGILSAVSAAICVDSGALHMACLVGTPTVALMPIFSAETRLSYYSGEIHVVRPPAELGSETYPAGKDAKEDWIGEIKPDQIMQALTTLLGQDQDGPRIIKPEGS